MLSKKKEPKPTSFSEFMHNASHEEREQVFKTALNKASASQRAMIEQAKKATQGDS